MIAMTSCGPMCQHPQCWYSNRRLDRGLPRTQDNVTNALSSGYISQDDDGDDEGNLPTLKVTNLLEDYGYDPNDRYPTRQPLPRVGLTQPANNGDGRSVSAPLVPNATQNFRPTQKDGPNYMPQMPKAPHQTPSHSRREPRHSSAQRRHLNKSGPARSAPYLTHRSQVSKVDMKDVFEMTHPRHQGVISDPKVYIWCPSKKAQELSMATGKEPLQIINYKATSSSAVQLKDVTADMIPETMETGKHCGKKLKKKESHQTPTGGRPYTHPAREPPPLTRRTLPQDFDEGIAQLLQLPREVLLELLEHTKESDLFDKNKVAVLLEKLMPLIRFDKENVSSVHHHEPSSPTNTHVLPHQPMPVAPLHSSGILRQKKVTLLDGRPKRIMDFRDPLRASPPTRMPLFLDEAACSGITTSMYTGQNRQDIDDIGEGDEERETMLLSPTVVSEELMKRKPLGPMRIAATDISHYSKHKVTFVSAKPLPPLEPGVRAIKPFNYATHSVDFALSPLSTPDQQVSEKPSSPHSGRASTVYVTVPSQLSDHSPTTSPVNYDRTPVPPIMRQSSAHYSNVSAVPSDDFNTLHGISSLDSAHVPKAPYETPAVVKQGTINRENTGLSRTTNTFGKVDLELLQNNVGARSPLNTPSVDPTLQTIHEGMVDNSQQKQVNTATIDPRDTSVLVTPIKPPASTTLPYNASTSVMAQGSDKAMSSPVPLMTPLLMTASPEVWPVIDERDYMKSPERKIERLSSKKMEMILAPVAPPPSPEPLVVDVDYDIQEFPKKSTAAALTPLAEEEEEEEDLAKREAESIRGVELNRTAPRSRGYLVDDEHFHENGEQDSRINAAETNAIHELISEKIQREETDMKEVNDRIETQGQIDKDENFKEEQVEDRQGTRNSTEVENVPTDCTQDQVVSHNIEQVDGKKVTKDENEMKPATDGTTEEDLKEYVDQVIGVQNGDATTEEPTESRTEKGSVNVGVCDMPDEDKHN